MTHPTPDPRVEVLRAVLVDMFENPQFQVSIGGNPNMVDALMERARTALASTAPGDVK